MIHPAKTKAEEIVLHLNNMEIGDPANVFFLRRYSSEAKAFRKDNPVAAYEILGAIACLEKKVDSMRTWHQKAITASGNDSSAILNYAMSLGKLGFVMESYDNIKTVFGMNATNKNKQFYIQSSISAGRVLEAYECARNLSEEDASEGVSEETMIFLSQAADILASKGISDDDVSVAIECVERCLHEQGVFGPVRESTAFASEMFILYKYSFLSDEADLLEIDFLLERKLEEAGVSDKVLSTLEVDFSVSNDEKKAQAIIPISEEKMAFVRELVADVEI